MHCEQVPLIELLGGELESSQSEQALSYVEGCPTCRERLQTMAAVKALYGREPSWKPSRLRFRSLGACDLGNPHTSGSPYWLGFAELFLKGPLGQSLEPG